MLTCLWKRISLTYSSGRGARLHAPHTALGKRNTETQNNPLWRIKKKKKENRIVEKIEEKREVFIVDKTENRSRVDGPRDYPTK